MHTVASSARAPREAAATRPHGTVGWAHSPRMRAQQHRLVQLFGANAVVQRRPTITGFSGDTPPSGAERFLRKHGLHWYYSYERAADRLDGTYDDTLEDAQRLAHDLGTLMAHLDDHATEVQEPVQRKLVEIAELVRSLMADPRVQESKHDREKRDRWYHDFILNGLCLGFVRVFEQHPQWMAALWRALQTWQPPTLGSVHGILAQLNHHLETHLHFDDGREHQNMWEAVLLAREAWDAMNEPNDPNADRYDPSPVDVVAHARGTLSDHHSESMAADSTWEADTTPVQGRWGLVRAAIDNVIGTTHGHFHIIIYHEGHEMAVHFHRPQQGAPSWTLVETNLTGIVACDSWDAVGQHVQVQLAQSTEEFGVEVRRQAPRG